MICLFTVHSYHGRLGPCLVFVIMCVFFLDGGYCQRPWMSPRSVCNWFNVCLLFPLRCHCLMTGCSSSGSWWQSTGTVARRQEAKWLLCSPCEGCLFAWLIYLPPLFGPSLFQGHAPLVLPLLFLGWASSSLYPWSARFVVESCLAGYMSSSRKTPVIKEEKK